MVAFLLAALMPSAAVHASGGAMLVSPRQQLEAAAKRLEAGLRQAASRLRPEGTASDSAEAAALVGTWTKQGTENARRAGLELASSRELPSSRHSSPLTHPFGAAQMDEFLDKALGVGYLKRRIAIKASQKQRITVRGGVVYLEITDRRGTKRHEMHPHGRVIAGKGFTGLPVQRRVTWARDGTLVMEERYAQHLGGEENGTPCTGDSCPVVRSHRGVRKGTMFVALERELLSGSTVRMKTTFQRGAERAG